MQKGSSQNEAQRAMLSSLEFQHSSEASLWSADPVGDARAGNRIAFSPTMRAPPQMRARACKSAWVQGRSTCFGRSGSKLCIRGDRLQN
eukprot:6213885-Pleurochrysis_carterae.AAC.3